LVLSTGHRYGHTALSSKVLRVWAMAKACEIYCEENQAEEVIRRETFEVVMKLSSI